MSIRALPEDVCAQIRSSVEITSLLDVAEGLLTNALDAGADSVSIAVDFAKGFCAVQDNGSGIPSSEFSAGGKLARVHCECLPWSDFLPQARRSSHWPIRAASILYLWTSTDSPGTSKLGSHCYGSYGRFLSCLSALSLLSITSLHRHDSIASNAVLKQGNVITRNVGSRDEELGRHGTRVVVHNLFGNVPVRFKQQAIRSTYVVEVERQFDTLKRLLVSYLLAIGRPVRLQLRSTDRLRYNHCCSAIQVSRETLSTNNIFNILRQAGLTTATETWKLASAKAGGVSVRCAVSLMPNPSKRAQFVSLGQYPIPPRGVASAIYDTINAIFEASAFGVIANADDGPASKPDTRKTPNTNPPLRKRPGKGVDRWPAFYIRIETKSTSQLTTLIQEYAHDGSLPSLLQEVFVLLKLLISRFLQSHSFGPKHLYARRRHLRSVTSSRQFTSDQTSFDRWKRLKSAVAVQEQELCSGLPFVDDRSSVADISHDDDVQLLLKEIELDSNTVKSSTQEISVHAQDPESTVASAQHEGDDDLATWRNPRTGKLLYLDARNGCVAVPAPQKPAVHSRPNTSRSHTLKTSIRRLSIRPSTSAELADRLKSWPRGNFTAKTEPLIPSLVQEEPQQQDIHRGAEQEVEATQLANARVLSQVDNKFILAMLPHSPHGKESSSLVLIDQHAADERVKVEEFFHQLCSRQCLPLARPVVFEVSDAEAKQFEQAHLYFASWAIDYQVRHRDISIKSPARQASIVVTRLPALIAERCRLEPSVLIQMLRKQIWSEDTTRLSSRPPAGTASWTSRVSQCPGGLVEMINSRACRTAIMFNDSLRHDQCEELLRRLSSCVLPFQCAHGRPNITIITTFGYEAGIGSQDDGRESFGKAFRRWCT